MGNEESQPGVEFNEFKLPEPVYTKTLKVLEKDIEEVPSDIAEISTYEAILLNRNHIKKLPGFLVNLKQLALQNNYIEDTNDALFETIASYPKLNTLDLANNKLKRIPAKLREVKSLQKLALSYNELETFDVDFPNLRTIDLGQNKFTQWPAIPPTVIELCLDGNSFDVLTLHLPQLSYLSISNCGLKSIENGLKFMNLRYLDLSKNQIKEYPDFSKFTPKLVYLDLSDGADSNIPLVPTSLRVFKFARNNCIIVPPTIANWANLVLLDLSYNRIEFVPRLPRAVEKADFTGNCINRVEPSELPSLKEALFAYNKISEFPLYKCPKTATIDVRQNAIIGLDPKGLKGLKNLSMKIDLADNQLPKLPNELFEVAGLKHLLVAFNQLGRIPDAISKSSTLSVLNASGNAFAAIPKLPDTLSVLSLCYCGLTEIPSSVTRCSNLIRLSLCGNEIADVPKLPSRLKYIFLSRNQIQSFPSLPQTAKYVDLSCNRIQVIPDSISLPNLERLNLARNNIVKIPEHANLRNLKQLLLGFNVKLAWTFDLSMFPSLEEIDAVATSIRFTVEPPVKQISVSKNKLKTKRCRITSALPWVGYQEYNGPHHQMHNSIVARAMIREDVSVFAVFDGIYDNKSSRMAAQSLQSAVAKAEKDPFNAEFLYNTMRNAVKNRDGKPVYDGCTGSVAMLKGNNLLLGQIGTTRLLILTSDGEIRYRSPLILTTDPEEIERVRSEGGSIINKKVQGIVSTSRALGLDFVKGICREPEIAAFELTSQDRWVVLASAILFDYVSEDRLRRIIQASSNARNFSYDIINIAVSSGCVESLSVVTIDILAKREGPAFGGVSKSSLVMMESMPMNRMTALDLEDDGSQTSRWNQFTSSKKFVGESIFDM